jgi:SAM-dependent methyltransferase
MGLRSPTSVKSAGSPVTASETEINYSVARLQRDQHERGHIRRELTLIKEKYSINDYTVLEVGCGLGHNLEIFKRDNRVLGVEGLPDAVAQARVGGLDVRQGDLEAGIDLGTGTADWVLCLDVLEHLVNPMNLMVEIRRVLREKGRVVINVPNHFDLTGRIKIFLGHDLDVHKFFPESNEWENPHLRFFTHRGITELVTEAGFKVVDDLSARFWSLPKRATVERLGLEPLMRILAGTRPSLFAGGFLLIAEKQVTGIDLRSASAR